MVKTFRFCDMAGCEFPAVTAELMREVDRIAVEETGPSLLQMMENAGRNLAGLTIDLLGAGWDKARILILAGGGGNGGGGICAARHLANRKADVSVILSSPDNLSDVTESQLGIYKFSSGQVLKPVETNFSNYDFIIDAMIGYGLKSDLHGIVRQLIVRTNDATGTKLSLDIPSGLDATTGDKYSDAILPDYTMTVALPKTGLRPENAGKIFLADIGLPGEIYNRIGLPPVPSFEEKFVIELNCR